MTSCTKKQLHTNFHWEQSGFAIQSLKGKYTRTLFSKYALDAQEQLVPT